MKELKSQKQGTDFENEFTNIFSAKIKLIKEKENQKHL